MKTYATRSIRSLLASALLWAGLATAAQAQSSVTLATLLDRAPVPAADTWSDFVRTDELAVRIDTARVERRAEDGALLVWVRFEYAEPVAVPSDPDRTYTTMDIREALDCRAQEVADLQALIRDGERVLATTQPSAENWKTFADHPFDTDLFILACRFLSPKAS